jgi:cytochrome c
LVRQRRRVENGSPALLALANPYHLALLALSALVIVILSGCAPQPPPARASTLRPLVAQLQPAPGVPGDPNNGMALFTARGCVACHTVLRLPNASGAIGPNLTNMTLRPTLAGDQIQMTPENLARWIVNPPAMKADTKMPVLGVTDQDARDLAAFLYSLPYSPAQ